MMRTVILIVLFCLSLPLAAFGHGDDEHPPSASRPLKDIMTSIENAIAAGKPADVHALTEEAATAAKAVASAHEANDPRRAAALRQFVARLNDLHEASDSGNIQEARSEFKKTQSAYRLFQAQQANVAP